MKPISAPRCLGSAAIVRSVSAAARNRMRVDRRLVLEGDRGRPVPAA